MIKENIKLYAKISAMSFLKWLSIILSGTLITIILFFVILFKNADGAGGGHGNPIAFIVNLLLSNPFDFILFAGAPVFIFLYFMVANKIAIQTIIYQVWTNHGIGLVESTAKKVIATVIGKPNLAKETFDEKSLKSEFIAVNKNDETSPDIIKKIVNYSLKKVNLDGIDLKADKTVIFDVILAKIKLYISETTKPGFMFFWILILVQIVLFICGRLIGQ